MDSISMVMAFLAGIASFLSPCVLPLVPAYITYLTGTSLADLPVSAESDATQRPIGKRSGSKPILRALAFVCGFSTIFIALGASASVVGQLLMEYKSAFRVIAGLIIVVFGLHLTGLVPIPGLYREARFGGKPKTGGFIGAFLLGMAFAAGWTPCVGPILSAIFVYAATGETLAQGIQLLTAYSIGLAIPFLITAMALTTVEGWFRRMGRHLPAISIVSGAVMIIIGVLILTDQLGRLSAYLNFLPNF